MMFVVTIQDKTLYAEPDVAIAFVEAPDEQTALRAADPTIEQLIERGRCRCVPHAREIEPGKFYRLGAVVRLPSDPNADHDTEALQTSGRLDLHKDKLPDLPCPKCRHADTVPLRNYGRPMTGEKSGSRWKCLECSHQFDGPPVKR